MVFAPHLCGSYSTLVSRSLHTSVHHAPHLCGLNVDFQPNISTKKQALSAHEMPDKSMKKKGDRKIFIDNIQLVAV